MSPRRQTAGTLGIVAGVALAVLFILYFTSGATPATFNDPAKALEFFRAQSGRNEVIACLAILTVSTAAVFVAGLASALAGRTPTRATATLYFGLGGLAGHALSAFIILAAAPWLVKTAAGDQVAAAHAYVAINGLSMASDSLGNFFVGLSTLFAGWAITATPGFGSALGWFGIVTGIVNAVAGLVMNVSALFLVSFLLPIVWLIWAGNTLRRMA
ncbi:MAG TPA: hypothetical protein VI007_08265 [bacterium]